MTRETSQASSVSPGDDQSLVGAGPLQPTRQAVSFNVRINNGSTRQSDDEKLLDYGVRFIIYQPWHIDRWRRHRRERDLASNWSPG
jgi:hypothetical protein